MVQLLRETKPKARKSYLCGGYEQIDDPEYYLPSHSIKKGEVHVCQVSVDMGGIWTWRSCQACYDYICENKLFEF